MKLCWRSIGLALLAIYLLTGPLISAFAQPRSSQAFRIDHIGVDNGLTQGSVYHMLHDSRGFLWLGTQDGLNRFDGHRFQHYRPAHNDTTSITGINIFGIVEDGGGNLWLGTENGLNRYDRASNRFSHLHVYDKNGKAIKENALPFYADARELLYLSELDGLVSYDLKTKKKQILHPDLKPPHEYDQPNSTIRTPSGMVWLHAPKGIVCYNQHTRKVHRYFSDYPSNEFGIPQTIFSFYPEPLLDVVWLGTTDGLLRFEPSTKKLQNIAPPGQKPLGTIYSIEEDQQGRLWIGTQRTGIWLYDKSSGAFTQLTDFTNIPKHLTDYEISKVYVDKAGMVWANTDPDGLARILPEHYRFDGIYNRQQTQRNQTQAVLSSNVIRSFLETSSKEIWIATERGIDVLDRVNNQITKRYLTQIQGGNLPSRNLIKSLHKDPTGRIWVGTVGGVFAFNPNTEQFDKIWLPDKHDSQVMENFVRGLVTVDANTLMAATEDGMFQLNIPERKLTQVAALKEKNIFSLYRDSKGRLWVGTYLSGFFCFEKPPLEGTTQRALKGLEGFSILHFYEDKIRQILWMATDKGLAGLNLKTGKIQLFGEQNGLANEFIYAVIPDHTQKLWVSTNRGLARFDPQTLAFKNFDLSDGLQGYEFNGNAYCRTTDGELFFGGVNGFNRFYPEHFRNSPYLPSVYVYKLLVNEEPYRLDQYVGEASQIELPYNRNTIALEYAALDFYSSGNNNYQYKLEPYDKNWVKAGSDTYVRYANLPPGTYTFQVRAANKDGQWSKKTHQLHITIKPPFWQTIWFISLVSFFLGAIGYVWLRRRENRIRWQQQQKVRLAVELQEQIKKNLSRDLHDEIGTRLATLKLYISRIATDSPTNPHRSGSLGDQARQLISEIITDVRSLLRELSPRTLEQYGYEAAVEELLSRIDESTLKIRFSADSLPARLDSETELMLYRITQELLNNTLKHANAQQVRILLQLRGGILHLLYEDDGDGFDYEKARRGLGIGNIESRVALIGGHIEWQTSSKGGTRAVVELAYRPHDRLNALKRLERSLRQLTS
ncbi:ligand-binding sensor domain-containing protein [Tellurirhabdus bombi]|uniref:ligand-binding sensor domain-containing protein n=1 Tax=Tellurirhabdus bombi TaxID=2907205 RepID=UPI001F266D65|nr:sensor histidine kinase [Tellurirhabdus bombi]